MVNVPPRSTPQVVLKAVKNVDLQTMDSTVLMASILSGLLSGTVVEFFNHFVVFPRLQKYRRKKVNVTRLHEYLDLFSELIGLYALRIRGHVKVEVDETGAVVRDESGKPQYKEKLYPPDPEIDEIISKMEGVPLEKALAMYHLKIRRLSFRVSDIAHELDPDGELWRAFTDLYAKMKALEVILKSGGIRGTFELLRDATTIRRALRHKINGHLRFV